MFFLIFSQIVFVTTSSNQSDSPPLIFHHSPRHLILSSLETEQELVHLCMKSTWSVNPRHADTGNIFPAHSHNNYQH